MSIFHPHSLTITLSNAFSQPKIPLAKHSYLYCCFPSFRPHLYIYQNFFFSNCFKLDLFTSNFINLNYFMYLTNLTIKSADLFISIIKITEPLNYSSKINLIIIIDLLYWQLNYLSYLYENFNLTHFFSLFFFKKNILNLILN